MDSADHGERGTDHPRDISAADLAAMVAMTPNPQGLREVVSSSRKTLGFFPAHNPRALEYPWIIAQMPQHLNGRRVLDVGAGVNVLPFMLAERGALVTTLDHHPMTRDPADRHDWNEWGYLDYSLMDARIASVRTPYEKWAATEPFDIVYSVSVIEHLPRDVRLAWVDNFRAQLESGGMLLLTVDLVPDSSLLWNHSEGKQVEDPAVHGDFDTLLNELRRAGFTEVQTDTRRGIPNCRVDVGFVRATKV